MTEHSQLPTVVFVGGGFAAALMRSTLESLTSKAGVIIVDEKHYTEYTVGALRGFVVPEKSAFLDVEHSHGWKKCKFIPGRLKTVKADKSVRGFLFLA
jgi:NADH dehydrogenase FAD-containing subunit